METIGALLVLLLTARLFGALSHRAGLPSAVGEMIAGMVLVLSAIVTGPHQPFVENLAHNEALAKVAELGIFFLVLMAGLEMRLADTMRDARKSFVVAVGGVVLPLVAGIIMGFVFLEEGPQRTAQAILVGVAISITAIAASAKLLQEFGLLNAESGRVLITAALFDDIFGLFLLALLSSMIATGELPGTYAFAIMLAKVILFFVVTGLLGVHVYPHISKRMQRNQSAAIEFSALVIVGLAYGFLAELLGLHWAVGAFMAGLFMEKTQIGKQPYESMRLILNALTAGILGPLFFAWIGLQANLTAIFEIPVFLLVLSLVAFASKVLGGGLAARFVGYTKQEAAIIGVGLAPRGEIMIVVMSIALGSGLINGASADPIARHLFSALILMALFNTALAPMVLRFLLRRKHRLKNER
ncbi:cation:proton antiporter [uncultured Maritalea sp.]|jgi:Kef-type K+ transport system membrane component KefB|uniref:cation:proton antiporter n=1 Tax=uncultured Maritalea sp. TaxID=757249 RepID=UPI0026214095|nr:cation:proton antiporter [uncultured Maritalea sp.]